LEEASKNREKCCPIFLKNVATLCKMLKNSLQIQHFLKNVGTFLKNVGTFLKNVDYKNVSPKNVLTFCKMLPL
jgi:hypothetical protein